jgi:MraZ protein
MDALFHGSALCEVDAEGNVRVPEFLSHALPAEPDALVVAKHAADRCLVAYGRGHLRKLRARAERRRRIEEERGEDGGAHDRRMRRTFGLSDRLSCDAQRFHLSDAMRHLGRIDRLALFVGTGDSFEIWNPQLALENDDEQLRALAEFRLRTAPRPGQRPEATR